MAAGKTWKSVDVTSKGDVMMTVATDGVYISSDNGANWSVVTIGEFSSAVTGAHVKMNVNGGIKTLVLNGVGVFVYSVDTGVWTKSGDLTTVDFTDLAISSTGQYQVV